MAREGEGAELPVPKVKDGSKQIQQGLLPLGNGTAIIAWERRKDSVAFKTSVS